MPFSVAIRPGKNLHTWNNTVDFRHAALIDSALPAVTGPARWTPREDGLVRQFFEETDDKGKWQTWFDGYYARVE